MKIGFIKTSAILLVSLFIISCGENNLSNKDYTKLSNTEAADMDLNPGAYYQEEASMKFPTTIITDKHGRIVFFSQAVLSKQEINNLMSDETLEPIENDVEVMRYQNIVSKKYFGQKSLKNKLLFFVVGERVSGTCPDCEAAGSILKQIRTTSDKENDFIFVAVH